MSALDELMQAMRWLCADLEARATWGGSELIGSRFALHGHVAES